MNTGQRIKQLRLEKNMTLEELGNKVGVGKSTVRKWENGIIANMRRDKIAKLASALECSPAYLMDWKEKNISLPEEMDLWNELREDKELLKSLAKYLLLSDEQKKLILNTIDILSEAKNEFDKNIN